MRLLPLLLVLVFVACGENPPAADHQSALPHQAPTEAAPTLSAADRAALQEAQGREAMTGSREAIEVKLQSVRTPLVAYQYWKLDCGACLKQNAALQRTLGTLPPGRVEVHYINLDPLDKAPAVNASIRAQGLTGPVYQLPEAEATKLAIRNGEPITLPHMQLYDPVDDFYIDYHVEMPAEVLQAVFSSMGAR